jgi:hypothetical protein
MAKRAPILPENYNPVGERLKRIAENFKDQPVVLQMPELPTPPPPEPRIPTTPEEMAFLSLRQEFPDTPKSIELKSGSVRFRCNPLERRRWHEIVREVSGDQQNLSHFIRAFMLLLDQSQTELRKMTPDIQKFQRPSNGDTLGHALYEHRLAQCLHEAIRLSEKPRA